MAKKQKRHLPIPTDLHEANAQISRIGELRRKIETIELNEKEEIAAFKTRIAEEVAPIANKLKDEITGLMAYADANRKTLLPGEKKSVSFGAGVLGWRNKSSKVHVSKGGDAALLQYLIDNRLWRFIRQVREPNKERLLQDRPVIPNVSYPGSEEFYVEPNAELASNRVRGDATESEL